jgi:hypothetical protein
MEKITEIDVLIQIQQVACLMNGMIAENKQREHLGESMAFTHDQFEALSARLEPLRDIIRS